MDTPILRPYLKSISDALRSKLGTTEKIKAEDFADKIMSIQTGGGSDFWAKYQNEGNRTDYVGAFAGEGWNSENFKPQYDIRPTIANHMFYYAKNIKNLTQLLKNAGVALDTSKCTSFASFFASADNLTHVPTISTVSCAATTNAPLIRLLYWNVLVQEVEKIVFKNDGSQVLQNCLEGLIALKKIVIEGKIGSTVDMQSSTKLTKDSIISIINALYENASKKTITFSKTAINREFGIDVSDESTYPEGSEFHTLRYSKVNWNFAYV